MLYVRERRVWVWLAPGGDKAENQPDDAEPAGTTGSSHATMALSTNRKTMDGDREFEMLKTKLLQAPQ